MGWQAGVRVVETGEKTGDVFEETFRADEKMAI
jgi:hypothetical protein